MYKQQIFEDLITRLTTHPNFILHTKHGAATRYQSLQTTPQVVEHHKAPKMLLSVNSNLCIMHVITINSVFCTSTKPWKQTWNPVAFSLHSIPSSFPIHHISFHITLVICWKIVLAILDLGEKQYFMKIAFRDESPRWHLLSRKMVVACCGRTADQGLFGCSSQLPLIFLQCAYNNWEWTIHVPASSEDHLGLQIFPSPHNSMAVVSPGTCMNIPSCFAAGFDMLLDLTSM